MPPEHINIAGKGVVVGPDDVLVVAAPAMTRADVDKLSEILAEKIGFGRFVIIGGANTELAVAARG